MIDLETSGVDSSKLRCWAHSHAMMDVFWSETDNGTVSNLANGEYLLALVVNKKRDAMMRLDQFHPTHFYMGDVVWEVHYPVDQALAEQCREEFKARVNEGFPILDYTNLKRQSTDTTNQMGILPDVNDEAFWWEDCDPNQMLQWPPEEVDRGC